jgi:hypothetical protein
MCLAPQVLLLLLLLRAQFVQNFLKLLCMDGEVRQALRPHQR